MGTRKISQLDTISDADISGEAILPVVVSDPLIPNRKAKVNQLFRGVAQGTKTAPGLTFDLDRGTGLYQLAYNQFGMSFGLGGLYLSRTQNAAESSSLFISAVDDETNNADIVLSPKGTGSVRVSGTFTIGDSSFVLEDAQGPKARFEIGDIGTGTNTRVFTLPQITSGNGTVFVGDDTTQTIRNKTILIDEDNLVITDGDEEAIFQINWSDSQGVMRSYFLPDAGPITTTLEPTATSSTLLDTKTEQIVLNKTMVQPKIVGTAEEDDFYALLDASSLTANRVVTIPDLNVTLVGLDNTQSISNKTYIDAIFADGADNSKRININLENLNTSVNTAFGFPPTGSLNVAFDAVNRLVTEAATQSLTAKTLVDPKIQDPSAASNIHVTLSTDNITAARTIKFPDADATLLSTDNVTLDDVNFGAGIGASNLTGRTRLQQFFYAGF